MVAGGYVPDTGHIVWLRLSPQAEREQAGHRPALVLSPQSYNEKTSLGLFCPITSRVKDYPFEVGYRFRPGRGSSFRQFGAWTGVRGARSNPAPTQLVTKSG